MSNEVMEEKTVVNPPQDKVSKKEAKKAQKATQKQVLTMIECNRNQRH